MKCRVEMGCLDLGDRKVLEGEEIDLSDDTARRLQASGVVSVIEGEPVDVTALVETDFEADAEIEGDPLTDIVREVSTPVNTGRKRGRR